VADRFDITRVRLRHYRSIAACDVKLGPMTLLVGPNGSGRSSFLDAPSATLLSWGNAIHPSLL
jgi:predicted ATP-binding protein involved in virulence